jgi:PAS domain-containing protein
MEQEYNINNHPFFVLLDSPDDQAAFQKEVSQSYKTGVYKDSEFRLMRYDGVYRWHLSRAIPVLNQYGAILKWVGVTIDIGKRRFCRKLCTPESWLCT